MNPQARTIKDALAEGRFGRLALCSAYIKWWRDNAYYQSADWRGTWSLDGGGALMNQSIHYVDLLQWLVGMPESVFANIATRAHEGLEVEDVACVSLRFANGALGVIEAATACYPGYERRIEICGDRGSAVLEDNSLVKWEFSEKRSKDDEVSCKLRAICSWEEGRRIQCRSAAMVTACRFSIWSKQSEMVANRQFRVKRVGTPFSSSKPYMNLRGPGELWS